MRRFIITCMTLAAAALLVLPAAGTAAPTASATAKAKKPKITRVQPMRVSVGRTLTITGRRFKARRGKNTIIFRSSSGRTAFAKPRRASSRKLVVTVPAAVSRLLTVAGGRQRPTRLKLRVLAGKFSSFTPRRLSPVVTGAGDGDGPGGGGGGGGGGGVTVCNDSADHDGDLLSNSIELAIGTDPCLADTDDDGMTDGWEYWSAKDLNIKAVPFPGKRPFPNALDPSDGGGPGARFSAYDFDGDGLTTLEEYRAWRSTGSSLDMSRLGVGLQSVLGYSDGTKFSRSGEVPPVPLWRSGSYGLTPPAQPFPSTYNLHGDAAWRDNERDADRDGLSNWLEAARGPSNNQYWAGFWEQDDLKIKPWAEESYCGQRPGHYDQHPFANLDLADPDVDGDSLLDGEDDQDHDDYTNIEELYELVYDLDGNGVGGENPPWCPDGVGFLFGPGMIPSMDVGGVDSAVNPFNPCAPNPDSRSCDDYVPF